jgi:hypothetical protein
MQIKQLLAPRETLLAISLLCQLLGFLGLLTRRRKLTGLGPRRINIRLIRSANIHPRHLKLRLLSLRTNHWVGRAQVGGTAAIIIIIDWRNLSANILLHLLILLQNCLDLSILLDAPSLRLLILQLLSCLLSLLELLRLFTLAPFLLIVQLHHGLAPLHDCRFNRWHININWWH